MNINSHRGNIALIILPILLVVLVVAGLYFWSQKQNAIMSQPLTWEQCLNTNGSTMATPYPATCFTPDGRAVIQPLSKEEKKKLEPSKDLTSWKIYNGKGYLFSVPSDWQQKNPYNAQEFLFNSPSGGLAIWTGQKGSQTLEEWFTSDLSTAPGYDKTKYIITYVDGKKALKSGKLGQSAIYAIELNQDKVLWFTCGGGTDSCYQSDTFILDKILSTFKFDDKNSMQKTSGPCSKDIDCAPGYKCWVPNCDAVKDLPGGDDCYITAPSCTKAY